METQDASELEKMCYEQKFHCGKMMVIMPFFKEGVHIFFSRKDITGGREKRKFNFKD